MSDLLPLIAATLKDKVAVDAQNEIEKLRNQIKLLSAVEIIHAIESEDNNQVVVYASGSFVDGEPDDDENLWEVNLEPGVTCRVSDLRECQLCVGGGFPSVTFNDQGPNGEGGCEGWFEGETNMASLCFFPHSTWVEVAITGLPEGHMHEHFHTEDFITYLVDTVAVAYPDTKIEFRSVAFVSGYIHGALKRLLPPQRRDEALARHREE